MTFNQCFSVKKLAYHTQAYRIEPQKQKRPYGEAVICTNTEVVKYNSYNKV